MGQGHSRVEKVNVPAGRAVLVDEICDTPTHNKQASELIRFVADYKFPEFNESEQKNKILVRVMAASVNPIDYKLILGYVPHIACPKTPFIGGFDAAGIVVAVGANCKRLKPGDYVYGKGNMENAFADYAIFDEEMFTIKPTNLTFAEAASIPLATATAYYALNEHISKANLSADVENKFKIFVNGGTTSVGAAAIQLARARGVPVIAATCSATNKEVVQGLGATMTIDYKTQDWETELKGMGFDIVLDCVGDHDSTNWDKAQNIMKSSGHFVEVAGDKGGMSMGRLMAHGAKAVGRKFVSLFGNPDYTPIILKSDYRMYDTIREMIEAKQIAPFIDRTYPIEQVKDAYNLVQSGHAHGKVVLVLSEDYADKIEVDQTQLDNLKQGIVFTTVQT